MDSDPVKISLGLPEETRFCLLQARLPASCTFADAAEIWNDGVRVDLSPLRSSPAFLLLFDRSAAPFAVTHAKAFFLV